MQVPRGASLAVFGTGAVGLAAVMAARLAGADPIIGVDLNPLRLKLALELGATQVIDSRHEDAAARIAAITGRGVDYVLEITGAPEMYQLALEVLNPQGTMALIATPGVRRPGPRGAESSVLSRGTRCRRPLSPN